MLLRRKVNRITDIVWMSTSMEYAREVLRLARAERDSEMNALATRFEQLVPAAAADRAGDDEKARARESGAKPARDYVGTLR